MEWATTVARKAGNGRGSPRVDVLPRAASHRSFFRLHLQEQSWIVMVSPPALEANDAFVTLARQFAAAGVRVPVVLAQDEARGFFLLSDLGTDHFQDAYQRGEQDRALAAGLRTLALIQASGASAPAYTRERFETELDTFETWFARSLADRALPPVWNTMRSILVTNAVDQPTVCIHRDYHCQNLLLCVDGEAGVVDFQDALTGPYTYDLACLLLDCYHRFDQQVVALWAERFRKKRFPAVAAAVFLKQLELVGLHRQLKALGIFVRLRLERAATSHLRYIEPVVEHARAVADRHPELHGLRDWLGSTREGLPERLAELA